MNDQSDESPAENEVDLLSLAACGDSDAQSQLAAYMLHKVVHTTAVERLTGAEVMARLAASAGAPKHRLGLAGILFLRAENIPDESRAAAFFNEAVGILDTLAKEGDEFAKTSLLTVLSEMADGGDEASAIALNKAVEEHGAQAAEAARLFMMEMQGEA